MSMLLLSLFVLGLFLKPTAAATSIMDPALTGAVMDLYPDPDGMLSTVCEYCAFPLFQCLCVHHNTAPYLASSLLSPNEPDMFPTLANHTEEDLAPLFEYIRNDRQLLNNEQMQFFNMDETTVQPETVQVHIDETYTVGDRLEAKRATRKAPHRRQAPRARGYPCDAAGCDKVFDRACERTRHQKTHLNSYERPHRCPSCNEGFLYPKDLVRHQRKHVDQPSAQTTFFCRYPGCGKLEGFSRRDNLLRHQRKQHPTIVASA